MCILLVVYIVSRRARRPRPRRTTTTTDMAPNHRDEDASPEREGDAEVIVEVHEVNVLQAIWENNKGAILILISELFGSSMDAMARYLQQGGARFHTLQVCPALWYSTLSTH